MTNVVKMVLKMFLTDNVYLCKFDNHFTFLSLTVGFHVSHFYGFVNLSITFIFLFSLSSFSVLNSIFISCSILFLSVVSFPIIPIILQCINKFSILLLLVIFYYYRYLNHCSQVFWNRLYSLLHLITVHTSFHFCLQ